MSEDDSDDTTRSTQTRWAYTNDAIALGYLAAFIVLSAIGSRGLIDLRTLPTFWRSALVLIALVAAAWTFGTAAVQAAAKLRG